MNILHLSAECYPAAKVGGLADVVGALPRYLNESGAEASVIMPRYSNNWLQSRRFNTVFSAELSLGDDVFPFSIQQETGWSLGFPLYVADIPGYSDRPGVYADPQSGNGYADNFERFLGFQTAVLEWLLSLDENGRPDIIHCHDHHTALVPFMMSECFRYKQLKDIPTVLTIHNGHYHGIYDHSKDKLLPAFDTSRAGLLDWAGRLNCLATGIKCAWQISTVSKTYMKELKRDSNGLELLFQSEEQKSRGILNGIDTGVWNPRTDAFLAQTYTIQSRGGGKAANKRALCDRLSMDCRYPLISFIGRLVHQKGADLLPDLFRSFFKQHMEANFVVLGSGDPGLHRRFSEMNEQHVGFFDATLSYNEKLAHQIYAGSDFMIIPSRFEPCGLNQMYAMRYGTIPIVRNVGGLKDTVKDLSRPGGYGFVFEEFSIEAASTAIKRALALYSDAPQMEATSRQVMELDFSWNASAKEYISMYEQLLNL